MICVFHGKGHVGVILKVALPVYFDHCKTTLSFLVAEIQHVVLRHDSHTIFLWL